MSWSDESDVDDRSEYRPPRERATGWRLVRRVAVIAGFAVGGVVGAVALVVGVVFAVNVMGTAANPGGFAAPAAYGARVALPPVASEPDSEPGTPEATDGETPEGPTVLSESEVVPLPTVDTEWISRIAANAGIPERALAAYAAAHIVVAEEAPDCGVDWATLAAIGDIESDHGRHGASSLDASGYADPPIIGPALDGKGVAAIADTDGGRLDGDTTWDRAVGPMQFIPTTWSKWASDGNGDDVADPHQIDDAALTTARYLCASGAMTDPEGWRAAVYSYNHDNDYVDKVATVANEYAAAAVE
ncbi:lytic transglycosylase domain-containing protein [Agromyces sp. NPDC127015]|uniref:lytic transglycosylase domain-containing protein n=1 Tax=Agromyces sp. NPDC127015 TaxID=3347108 RepID=UPI003650A67D